MNEIKEIEVSPFEISVMKSDLRDLILRELIGVENFWKYRFRTLIALGISLKQSSDIEVDDNTIVWKLRITIPEELVIDLAKRRKRKGIKLPKPRPLTRQMLREAEERVERLKEELEEMLQESETKEGGE